MSPRVLAALAGLLFSLHGVTHAARPGDPDPVFGENGTVRMPLPDGDANDVLVLADGSIVLGGTGDPDGDGVRQFILARLDASGAPLAEFGDGGLVATSVPLSQRARIRRLALDPDGRIVGAGLAEAELATGETSRLIMARWFADGELDREFGTDGLRDSVRADAVGGIVVGEDRGITFVGRNQRLIGGILSPGSAFAWFQFPEESDGSDVVSHLGGLLMAGTLEGDFFMMRLVGGLALDAGFGDGGIVRTPIGTGADRLRRLVVLPDGKIIAVGSTGTGPFEADIALVRYTAEGVLDPTFGDAGIVVTPLEPELAAPLDAVLAPDGTILVAGMTCSPWPSCHGFVARFLPEGRIDPDFGVGGVVATPDLSTRLAMADDGHVLVVQQRPDELTVSRLVVARCGNGRVEAGEACDDGNTASGDCCDATCALEADGSPCADEGSICTADACRAGTCAHVVPVEAGCLAASASALARVGDDVPGGRLRWSWQSAAPVDRALFGDPTATTDVTVCFLAGAGESDRAALEITVPAAGTCGAVPCWKETRRGFRFKDPTAAGGVARLRLISGTDGSLVELKAHNLSGVAGLPVPLTVRLVRHDADACFEAKLGPARGAALELQ